METNPLCKMHAGTWMLATKARTVAKGEGTKVRLAEALTLEGLFVHVYEHAGKQTYIRRQRAE